MQKDPPIIQQPMHQSHPLSLLPDEIKKNIFTFCVSPLEFSKILSNSQPDIYPSLGKKVMFKRYIKPLLTKALKRSPVVLLNGAHQVGKTTLALEFMKEGGYTYLTFDDEITYLAAKSNSTDF